MANSSMFVFPKITAPAASRFLTASAVNIGWKLPRIFELQVVSIPFVHMLSLIATGTPASGPVSVPSSINFCTSSALFNAPSLSSVTKLFTSFSTFSICAMEAFTASTTDISFALIFFPSSTAVRLVISITVFLLSDRLWYFEALVFFQRCIRQCLRTAVSICHDIFPEYILHRKYM